MSFWLVLSLVSALWIALVLVFVALCRAAASGDASLRLEIRGRRA